MKNNKYWIRYNTYKTIPQYHLHITRGKLFAALWSPLFYACLLRTEKITKKNYSKVITILHKISLVFLIFLPTTFHLFGEVSMHSPLSSSQIFCILFVCFVFSLYSLYSLCMLFVFSLCFLFCFSLVSL